MVVIPTDFTTSGVSRRRQVWHAPFLPEIEIEPK
jgi:hypothetical protein